MKITLLKWLLKVIVYWTTGYPPTTSAESREWLLKNWDKYIVPIVGWTQNTFDDKIAKICRDTINDAATWTVTWMVIQGEIPVSLGTLAGTESGILAKIRSQLAFVMTGKESSTHWVGVQEPRKVVLVALILAPIFGKSVEISGVGELFAQIESEE